MVYDGRRTQPDSDQTQPVTKPIQAIIFDFDGTIVDTELPEYQSWCEVYRRHGCELPVDVWGAAIGTGDGPFDPYAYLESLSRRRVERQTIRSARQRRVRDLIADQGPCPGVEAHLRAAKKQGLKVGLASSSPLNWVGPQLARLGLTDFFQAVSTSDNVAKTKPDPELYCRTLATLQVDPKEAIAIEDSPNGVQAAVAAGIFCVAVPNKVTSQLKIQGAHLTLESLASMSLGELIGRAQQHGA